jgi:HEAT repeat protein
MEAAQSLGEVGDAHAVKPLIILIEDSFHYPVTKTAVGALENVLSQTAANVVSADVRAAAALEDVSGSYYECREGTDWFSETRKAEIWTMDCSRVRMLANQELSRRGPQAEKR